jgi:L-rhamnose mutarotase
MNIFIKINKNIALALKLIAIIISGGLTIASCQNNSSAPETKTTTEISGNVTARGVKTKDIAMMVNLVNDSAAIAAYDEYHANAWPEVIAANKPANIEGVKIYRLGNRLVMILTVPENWDGDKDNNYVKSSPKVKEWLDIMGKFQQPSPEAPAGTEGWAAMKLVFGYEDGKQVYE